jgi:hypothetical protein
MDDAAWVNPFERSRRLDPDDRSDRALIRRFVFSYEPDPVDAEDLALGIVESIRVGEAAMMVEGEVVVLRSGDGGILAIPAVDLR